MNEPSPKSKTIIDLVTYFLSEHLVTSCLVIFNKKLCCHTCEQHFLGNQAENYQFPSGNMPIKMKISNLMPDFKLSTDMQVSMFSQVKDEITERPLIALILGTRKINVSWKQCNAHYYIGTRPDRDIETLHLSTYTLSYKISVQ